MLISVWNARLTIKTNCGHFVIVNCISNEMSHWGTDVHLVWCGNKMCWVHKYLKKNDLYFSLAGVSRSVTIAAAYLMTVTSYGWRDSLHAIRGARNCANPNFGFQRQLMSYECEKLEQVDTYRFECNIAYWVLSCLWDGAYKRTLAANRKE